MLRHTTFLSLIAILCTSHQMMSAGSDTDNGCHNLAAAEDNSVTCLSATPGIVTGLIDAQRDTAYSSAYVEDNNISSAATPSDACSDSAARRAFVFSIKTNMLYDLATVPNVSVEIPLGKGYTVSAGGHYAGWWNKHRNRFIQTYGGELELRRYFGPVAMSGHHAGIYGQALAYDLEWGGPGYLSDFSYGFGVSYGYSLAVKSNLHIDFSLGLGYFGGKYKKYEPKDGHYVWQETRNRQWWGPTRLEVTLAWLINTGRKEVRHE